MQNRINGYPISEYTNRLSLTLPMRPLFRIYLTLSVLDS